MGYETFLQGVLFEKSATLHPRKNFRWEVEYRIVRSQGTFLYRLLATLIFVYGKKGYGLEGRPFEDQSYGLEGLPLKGKAGDTTAVVPRDSFFVDPW